MIAYRKFNDAFSPTSPKPPKAPKVISYRRTLGGLGALGAGQSEIPDFDPAPDAWTDEQDERAAIVEYDGCVPRDWAEGFARLDRKRPPELVPLKRWWRFIDDCGRFLDGGWAQRAEALGWGTLQLFGCDRRRPYYVAHRGLLWEINGGRLIVLYHDGAIIETPRGDRLRYRRQPLNVGHVVLAWKLS